MIELEQIAKQVSLLNRLIELLVMQEESTADPDQIYSSEIFYKHIPTGFTWDCMSYFEAFQGCERLQKAWSDELVRVVRELMLIDAHYSKLSFYLFDICQLLNVSLPSVGLLSGDKCQIRLEAILNKHGRTLSK